MDKKQAEASLLALLQLTIRMSGIDNSAAMMSVIRLIEINSILIYLESKIEQKESTLKKLGYNG